MSQLVAALIRPANGALAGLVWYDQTCAQQPVAASPSPCRVALYISMMASTAQHSTAQHSTARHSTRLYRLYRLYRLMCTVCTVCTPSPSLKQHARVSNQFVQSSPGCTPLPPFPPLSCCLQSTSLMAHAWLLLERISTSHPVPPPEPSLLPLSLSYHTTLASFLLQLCSHRRCWINFSFLSYIPIQSFFCCCFIVIP